MANKSGKGVLNYATESSDEYAPTFYYKSSKVLEEKNFSKGSPEDVKKMLSGSGVKAEEMKWLDIDTFP